MKKLVIVLFLSILTSTIQGQRLSFEPEFGIRAQKSKVQDAWPNQFLNGTRTLASTYKSFWRYDYNISGSLNTKINNRWSITTGFQYFNYKDYMYRLENQPWPIGWDEKVLVNINVVYGLKFGLRYNFFKRTDAKYGGSAEIGFRYLFKEKTKYLLTEDTLSSVAPNGYDATKVFFYSTGRYYSPPKESPNPYFIYFSFRPYYQINKYLKLIGSIDLNLIGDYIIINNNKASFGKILNVNYNYNQTADPNNQNYGGDRIIYGENYLSWNFSIGLQIPIINDKPKKPVYTPDLQEDIYGL